MCRNRLRVIMTAMTICVLVADLGYGAKRKKTDSEKQKEKELMNKQKLLDQFVSDE